MSDYAEGLESERPRLTRLAHSILNDRHEAEDVVQQAWFRLQNQQQPIENLAGWLTTVVTRLCLDRLRARVPTPVDSSMLRAEETGQSHSETIDTHVSIGEALGVVLAALTPRERVVYVLRVAFDIDFATIAAILDAKEPTVRKLLSRAKAKAQAGQLTDGPTDWDVVDSFLTAARTGDFVTLLLLLAPDAVIASDAAALLAGTPEHISGRSAIASFFDGAASAALPVFVEARAGAAWFHQGEARVAFDFAVHDGHITSITFRADQALLDSLTRRDGGREK